MRIHIISTFPEFFDSPLSVSIPKRAIEKGLVEIQRHQLRDYTIDKHRSTDDVPFGGGAGMIMKPEPWFKAIRAIAPPKSRIIYLTPQGRSLSQELVEELAQESILTVLCGRYKGVDERVCTRLVTDEISVGDYILSGGEPAALVLIDAIIRLIPGVLGDFDSAEGDSFTTELLDYPHYTRPQLFEDLEAPPVLLSGHHRQIEEWRRRQALQRTLLRRPDLLEVADLHRTDRHYLRDLEVEMVGSAKRS